MSTVFRSQTPQAALAAIDASDALDAAVQAMYETLARSASVLSEEEYQQACGLYSACVADARAVRAELDRLLDEVDPRRATSGEAAQRYADLTSRLHNARKSLTEPAATLRTYADAQIETQRRAGDLAQSLAHLRSLTGSVPADVWDRWAPVLDRSQQQLNDAADQARQRHWLAALATLETSLAPVRELMAESAEQTTRVGGRLSQIAAVAAANDRLRVAGADAVAAWQRWSAANPGPEADQMREQITAAGSTFQLAAAAVAAWNLDKLDERYDVTEVADQLADANRVLSAIVARCDTNGSGGAADE